MPRPAATPVRDAGAFGEGRASQPAVFAAAFTTLLSRSSRRCFRPNATGSALARAASSSMNDSCANVFCNRAGERSGPVKNGDALLWISARSDGIVPVPSAEPPTVPVQYDGTPFVPLL